MKILRYKSIISLAVAGVLSTGSLYAQTSDITEKCCVFFGEPGLVGPGSVVMKTEGDTMFSLGMTTRIIPTVESNWDFGLSKVDGLDLVGGTANNLFVSHFAEAGVVSGEYIRGQANIYMNALPEDESWSMFLWLQSDSTLDIISADQNAGAGNQQSDFGIERLHLTALLNDNLRLHTGWALWDIDMGPGAGLVYLDDNPGVWFTGWSDDKKWDWSFGWFKQIEKNTIRDGSVFAVPNGDSSKVDSDLYAGFLDQAIGDGDRVRYFYTYNAANDIAVGSLSRNFAGQTTSTIASTSTGSDSSVHHLGALYTGTSGGATFMLEGVSEFGSVDNAGLEGVVEGGRDNYDVNAFALAGNLSYKMKSMTPHFGFIYTSGDDDATDGTLGGYTANLAGQRFTSFGGENTVLNDTNMMLGTALFGLLPEGLGNGTPVYTGGIANFAGFGFGRGDNPGLLLIDIGLSTDVLGGTYSTSVHYFNWNEDFLVESLATGSTDRTVVKSGNAGTEWVNQFDIAVNSAVVIKFQATALFPGDRAKDVTEAYGAGGAVNTRSDEVITRIGTELVWNF